MKLETDLQTGLAVLRAENKLEDDFLKQFHKECEGRKCKLTLTYGFKGQPDNQRLRIEA